MATISQFNLSPSMIFSSTPKHPLFTSKPVFLSLNSVKAARNPVGKLQLWSRESVQGRLVFWVRSVDDDEELISEDASVVAVAVAKEEKPEKDAEIESLKKVLVDSFYGTDRGLRATSETRAEVVEFITQLEAKNPTPAPTEALTLLNGKWILA